jgi:hypothetical protein
MALSSYGTLQFWLDAGQEGGFANGANMTGFGDRSGNGRDFLGDGTGYPTMRRTEMNGQPAAYMAADVNRRFQRAHPALVPGACTLLFVIKFMAAIPAGATNRFIMDTDSDNGLNRHYGQWMSTGALLFGTDGGGGSVSLPAGSVVPNKPSVLSVTYNGSSSEVRLDLSTVATGTINSSTASGSSTVIAGRFAGDLTLGPVALSEVVCYTAPLSTVNLVGATKELMAEYRIPVPGVVIG